METTTPAPSPRAMYRATLQRWEDDHPINIGEVIFDASVLLENMLPEDVEKLALSTACRDKLFYRAVSAGLIPRHDGPFEVRLLSDRDEAALLKPRRPTPIRRVSSKIVYEHPRMMVYLDEIIHPDGQSGEYVYIGEGGNGVTVIPSAVKDGVSYVAMVRQHRYVVNDFTLEFPGGGIQGSAMDSAYCELREETGMEAISMKCLGSFYALSGSSPAKGNAFLAEVPAASMDINYVESESGAITEWFSADEVRAMMRTGTINCGVTLAVLGIAFAHGYLI